MVRVSSKETGRFGFICSIHGKQMMGTAKAGMLPASKVTGERMENAEQNSFTQV
ncbi:hypothetical protein [Paenibacillus periandrae]|uniref:hypothetical protein n=1 Tax=Paenibacillus periandrae TaxID=1761741 RepID=UPI001F0905E0|nr:hypothetical protein [Paenibacillus periandrae]